jgi:hypothetical protein
MLGGKFIFTLIGLLMAIFAICKLDFGPKTIEGWGGLQLGRKAMPVAKFPNGQTTAVGGNFFAPNFSTGYTEENPNYGSGKFVTVPHFQSILSPRMSGGVDYGAYIRYNKPDYQNLAVPCNPLTFGDMANENYVPRKQENTQSRENYGNSYSCGSGGGCGGSSLSCGKGGINKWNGEVAGGYELAEGPGVLSADPGSNKNELWAQLRRESNEPDTVNELPVGTMTTMDASGDFVQPVVFDRLMYAPLRKSRLSAQGDYIRGDLPIVACQGGWFSVAPNINVDLQAGAMGVLGGANALDKDLTNLIVQASGGSQSTMAGIDLSDVNQSTQMELGLGSGFTDVMTTSFP